MDMSQASECTAIRASQSLRSMPSLRGRRGVGASWPGAAGSDRHLQRQNRVASGSCVPAQPHLAKLMPRAGSGSSGGTCSSQGIVGCQAPGPEVGRRKAQPSNVQSTENRIECGMRDQDCRRHTRGQPWSGNPAAAPRRRAAGPPSSRQDCRTGRGCRGLGDMPHKNYPPAVPMEAGSARSAPSRRGRLFRPTPVCIREGPHAVRQPSRRVSHRPSAPSRSPCAAE